MCVYKYTCVFVVVRRGKFGIPLELVVVRCLTRGLGIQFWSSTGTDS